MGILRFAAGLAACVLTLSAAGAANAMQVPGETVIRREVPRTTARRAELDVTFAPTPAYVIPVEPMALEDYDTSDGFDSQVLLLDRQTDGRGRNLARYSRLVVHGDSASSVMNFSSFELTLDPVISSLEIHHARYIRDGRVVDMTQDVSVDVLRQEDALSQGYFTGQVTALVRVPGGRAGDTLDVAYSIIDRNPTLNGRHSLEMPLAAPITFQNYHVRILWPRDQLRERMVGPEIDINRYVRGDDVEIVLGPGRSEGVFQADGAPSWRFTAPGIILSRFENWAEVARWAEPYYQPRITPEVRRIAQDIQSEFPERDDQIAAAVRYVQREISYFAILLGEGGYEPISPSETLRYSEGDCKAKSLLLISILAALGVDAEAAIVATDLGPALLGLPATPQLFNHVIVTFNHEGRRYWFDPTRAEQYGHLDAMTQADFGYALVIDPQFQGLVNMGQPQSRPLLEVSESFDITSTRHRTAETTVEWTMSGSLADVFRQAGESTQEDALERLFAGFYTYRFEDPIRPVEVEVIDDLDNNQLIARWTGQAVLPNHARSRNRPTLAFGAHAVTLSGLGSSAKGPSAEALALPYPFHARQTTQVSWPEDERYLVSEALTRSLDSEDIFMSFTTETGASNATLTSEVIVRDWELSPDAMEDVGAPMEWLLNEGIMVIGQERRVTGDRRLSDLDLADRQTLNFNLFGALLSGQLSD